MWPSLTSNYLASAIFLNPVIILHSLNSLLSQVLPTQTTPALSLPSPRWPWGPPAERSYLDLHSSEKLCWSYTAVMVLTQLFAFIIVHHKRGNRKERVKERQASNHASVRREGNRHAGRDAPKHKDEWQGTKGGTYTSTIVEG